MGGYSGGLGYWWQASRTNLDPDIQKMIGNGDIHINALELAAIVVNYYAAAQAFIQGHMTVRWQPKVHCGGDNTSANSWYSKFLNPNKQGRRLTKLLAMGQKSIGLDMDIGHVAGIKNGLADAVSRGRPKATLEKLFKQKFPSHTAALTCLQVPLSTQKISLHRFHLSNLLKSHISSILLGNDTAQLPSLNKSNLGRITPGSNIIFDFVPTSWEWTLD